MYVTRHLSEYRKSANEPERFELEGPNTGVLVIDDDDLGSEPCCGLFGKKKSVKVLPFPQNKILKLRYLTEEGDDELDDLYVLVIPVLNQPLSANQYYIFIKSRGKTKGLAYTSSNEDDPSGCCCFNINHTTPTQVFDPRNAHQQFQIYNCTNCKGPYGFKSKSMAPHGIPPHFLRHKGWKAYAKTLKNFTPTQALGLDTMLRAHLPRPDSESIVVGRWYCPFIFIREGKVDAQVKNSPYYEVTLEQNWEEIFGCYKSVGHSGVAVDVCVKRQVVLVEGSVAGQAVVDDGVMWFGSSKVGLSMVIVERVKWEQERGGFIWRTHEEQEERVVIREEFKGMGVWKRCGCYVLVERFVLRRMDGSLVLTWEFRHTHQIRTKWE